MPKIFVNREGGDTIFYTKVGGVSTEIFRASNAGVISSIGGFSGFGAVPVGSVIPILSHITGSYNCVATTAADASGFVQCNGQTIADATSPMNGQAVPDINGSGGDPVFLRGSTAPSSTKAGDNTITTSHLPVHTHSAGSLGADGVGGHEHAIWSWWSGQRVGGLPGTGTGWTSPALSNNASQINEAWKMNASGDGAHGHSISGSTGNGGFANSSYIPKYLPVKYIIRIK